MAIDLSNVKSKYENKLNNSEKKLNDIFNDYGVPAELTDNNDKLTFALHTVVEDHDKREQLKNDFKKAEENIRLESDEIKEDFIGITTLAYNSVKKNEKQFKESEELVEAVREELKNAVIKNENIDKEINTLKEEKKDIQKQRKLKLKELNSEQFLTEFSKLGSEIKEKNKEVDELKKKIDELKDKMNNEADPIKANEFKKEIMNLETDLKVKENESKELSTKQNEKKAIYSNCSDEIDRLDNKIKDIDSSIEQKEKEKENTDILAKALEKREVFLNDLKAKCENEKSEYEKQVGNLEKFLAERGIDAKALKFEEIVEEKAKEEKAKEEIVTPEKAEEDEPIIGSKDGNIESIVEDEAMENFNKNFDIDKIVGEDINVTNNPQPIANEKTDKNKFNGQNKTYTANENPQTVGQTLPDKTPEQKKEDKINKFIESVSNDDGLASYDEILSTLQDLKLEKLSKEDKNKIKEGMEKSKGKLAEVQKDVDSKKLGSMLNSVGLKLDDKDLIKFHGDSFEGHELPLDKAANIEVGKSKHGILNGFASMSKNCKSAWKEFVDDYAKNKKNMSEEKIAEVEKYIITPIKFGVLHSESKNLCQSNFMKFFKPNGDKVVNLIKDAIKSLSIKPKEKTNTFREGLNAKIVENPPRIIAAKFRQEPEKQEKE